MYNTGMRRDVAVIMKVEGRPEGGGHVQYRKVEGVGGNKTRREVSRGRQCTIQAGGGM